VQCETTGFVFLADPPEYECLETELAWEKTAVEEKQRRYQAEPIVSHVSAAASRLKFGLFPKRSKIATIAAEEIACLVSGHSGKEVDLLDIGCGTGGLLLRMHQTLADQGINSRLTGIEVSKSEAETGQTLLENRGRIIQANALAGAQQLAPNSIDVVLMSCFLEHEAQPHALLTALRPVLRQGGMIVLKVPNFASWNRHLRGQKWCGFRYPDHVNYFTPKSLAILCEQTGYQIKRQSWREKLPISDNMYAVLCLSGLDR
jgi:2-polyprenyl-3-methyl-5-hydroxy-6-metoxy-1,4-benzoquinol methylase